MTGDASAATRESPEANQEEWSAMIDTLDTAVEEARRKVENGRVYDAENEKVRIKWVRALAYAVNVKQSVMKHKDLEELSEKIDRIEERQEQRVDR